MKRLSVLFLIVIAGCTTINKASKLYQQKNYDTAIKECRAIIAKDSFHAKAHLILGRCYQAKGKLSAAVASFKTAFEITPSTEVTSAAKIELVRSQLLLADSLAKKKNYNLALNGYNYVLQIEPANVSGLMKLGDLYADFGFLSKARDQYQKLLNIEEDNQLAVGKIQEIDRRSVQAEQDFQTGREKFEKNDYQGAIKYLEAALKNEPDHLDAQFYVALSRGLMYFTKGNEADLSKAIEEFKKAQTLNPDSGEPHYFLGLSYEKQDKRKPDKAIDEFKLYLKKEPDGRNTNYCQQKIKDLTELRDR